MAGNFETCENCGRRFYYGFSTAESWAFRGDNGEGFCSLECLRQYCGRGALIRRLKERREKIAEAKAARREEEAGRQFLDVSGDGSGEEHRERNATYRRRKAAGICPKCGKNPAAPGKTYCDDCRAADKARRERDKETGVCTRCRSAPAMPGKTICAKCAEVNNRICRERAEARKAAGICIKCGKNPAAVRMDGGRAVECAECIALDRERKKRLKGAWNEEKHKNE